ncbi:MAG TPA: hypothetical protein VH877_18685 [Polyangia bacterium]|nr:hypothetical protein [Polyangia bacterium]
MSHCVELVAGVELAGSWAATLAGLDALDARRLDGRRLDLQRQGEAARAASWAGSMRSARPGDHPSGGELGQVSMAAVANATARVRPTARCGAGLDALDALDARRARWPPARPPTPG